MLFVKHKRPECIGCVACVEHAPDHFEMCEDGLVSLRRKDREDRAGIEYARATPCERAQLQDAVEACPTNIISLQD